MQRVLVAVCACALVVGMGSAALGAQRGGDKEGAGRWGKGSGELGVAALEAVGAGGAAGVGRSGTPRRRR